MNYQKVGTHDAGVFASSGNAAPVMTMDAAGIATGGAFLVSELEKRDPLIRKPLTSVTYPRDIPIQTGGGWVEYVSAMSVSYGMTGGAGDSAVGAGGANGTPIVQASVDKGLYKTHAFTAALRVMWMDMQRANFIGRSLDNLLQDGVRLAYDKHMDENTYVGFEVYGTTGLVNNPNATETTAASVSTGDSTTSTKWADKTPAQILADFNTALTTVWAANEYDESAIPNHVIMPYEQFTYLQNTMVTELAGKSILDYLMENNIYKKQTGRDLYIGGTRWCKGAGSTNTDRMVVYINDERFIKEEELVPLSRAMSQPNATNFCYDTAYAANISEVEVFYPTSILYVDGI